MTCAAHAPQWTRMASCCSTMSSIRIGPKSAWPFIGFSLGTRNGEPSAGLTAGRCFVEKELPDAFERS